jgi:hypothetical protein
MHDQIQRRQALLGAISAAASFFVAGSVMAAPKTYKYRCMKCKLIQEYGQPGTKKCPNDGQTMVRQN